MRKQRTFSLDFKRQVVEEYLGGEGAAQLCRKYNICSSLLYHWKEMYSRGRFNNEPTEVGALKGRIEKLERLVGKLTLENEVLKKHVRTASVGLSETAHHQGMGMPWHCHPLGVQSDETVGKQLLS